MIFKHYDRTFIRRLTRLSLGFSKKREYLKYAVALHSAFYNFWRVHRSLRVTPAMEAGIAERIWPVGSAHPVKNKLTP
ncbi:MAG: hypothetical protein DMG08_02515 [Acidobacteria bacterium]|nr:MAG: hypothetical protein DMG08_02515 [Acidobacteriota bacterium]PYV01967.1 MAG: hypothetical protein DMG10_16085 [Acidobacteriota bacterium]PYV41313.1 MAG: hypothetical protein DMG09_04950 [Acidobacteriota bacterium]